MNDWLSKRTKSGVVNGRLVRLTAEDGPVGAIVTMADAVFDRLLDDPPSQAEERWTLRGRGQGYVTSLHAEMQGEYTHEEIRWQLEHRRAARLESQ